MSIAYLSLGSNVGNRDEHLRVAIAGLNRIGDVGGVSSFYETEPVEFTAQPWFLNCAVSVSTKFRPQDLLEEILSIEREMGRDRALEPRKGPRVIDIDILLFDDVVLNSPMLTIPHPSMHQRGFVLEPLAEIAAQVSHPVLKKRIPDLLLDLPKGQAVRRIKAQGKDHAPTTAERPTAR